MEALAKEKVSDTLSKFKNTPITTVTLVYGQDVEDLTNDELVDALRKVRKEMGSWQDVTDTDYGKNTVALLKAAESTLVGLLSEPNK